MKDIIKKNSQLFTTIYKVQTDDQGEKEKLQDRANIAKLWATKLISLEI